VLGLHGVAGHTSWTASLLGFSTNLNDAAPGVILFVVGIFIVLITGFKVKASEILHPSPIREEPAKQSTEAVARTTDKDQNDPPPRQSNEGGGASFTSPCHFSPGGVTRNIDYTSVDDVRINRT
jgi:hypothetical protein